MAKILIVDDHDVVRQGARAILQRARPEWEICGEASNGREAIQAAKAFQPDVVILDISMPQMTGIEATPIIAKAAPNCSILLFTMHESKALLEEARELGARGYVQKCQAGRDLVAAVAQLLAGGTFFEPDGPAPPRSQEAKPSGESSPEEGFSAGNRMTRSGRQAKPAAAGAGKIAGKQKVLPAAGKAEGGRCRAMCLIRRCLQLFRYGGGLAYA